MNISEKQKHYLNILEMVLPYLRSIQTHGFWGRIRFGQFYAEAELVHNLPRLLVCPDFQEGDVHWLNTQARIFLKRGRHDFSFREAICDEIKQLFKLVPKELQNGLSWEGP
ncbi:MAG: hypothetical protein JWQ71_4912 [Pedosphaera sp.]|nr:hypothetical protein [Pedosphaera sp.]